MLQKTDTSQDGGLPTIVGKSFLRLSLLTELLRPAVTNCIMKKKILLKDLLLRVAGRDVVKIQVKIQIKVTSAFGSSCSACTSRRDFSLPLLVCLVTTQ